MFNLTKYVLFSILAIFIFTGCAPKISVEYRPKTTLEFDGKIAVNDFKYFPKGNTASNIIPNTALGGGIELDDPIGKFFANAVRREFRQAGLSLKNGGCKLDGEVNNLLIDDLGFTVDYISDVRYILYDKNGVVLLDNNYNYKLDGMSKFVVADVFFQNLNKMFSENIKKFMEDGNFVRMVDKNCNK